MMELQTKYSIIHYENEEYLKIFGKKLSGRILIFPEINENYISSKVDFLFKRTKTILGMEKSDIKKVFIQLCKNKAKLDHYFKYYYGSDKNKHRSWYIFQINTIFINICDIDKGMLAHEMVHHITDNYFGTKPPRNTAEILACYVNKNLHKPQKERDKW